MLIPPGEFVLWLPTRLTASGASRTKHWRLAAKHVQCQAVCAVSRKASQFLNPPLSQHVESLGNWHEPPNDSVAGFVLAR